MVIRDLKDSQDEMATEVEGESLVQRECLEVQEIQDSQATRVRGVVQEKG